MEAFLEALVMRVVVFLQAATLAVILTILRSEVLSLQPAMWDQASLEPIIQILQSHDASSNGEKISPGTQAREPQVPITVLGTEIRSHV